ncbi:MAG: carboxyl transferase domain-containing protein [Acidobacteriota bacterium]
MLETRPGSRLDPRSESFRANRARMLEQLDEVRRLEARVRATSERATPKLRKRGQLPARERVARLLDPGAPFLELSTLAGLGLHDDDGPDKDDGTVTGGGAIAGIGVVSGVRCALYANDAGIKGGAISPMGLRKNLRLHEIALENRLPLVNLVESAGANLLYQSEIFIDGGRIFANLARLSAAGIPVITVVHGSSTAGGAYLPGLSDHVVMVRGRAKVFLAGGPLVKAALGEDADEEELGGAAMHGAVTGSAEHLADDDVEALERARAVIASLGWPAVAERPHRTWRPPLHDAEELLGVVPLDPRQPYDCRELIVRLVDDSDFLEVKPGFGPHTVCGRATIEGWPVGILANDGPIDVDSAAKATHFIHGCCQTGTPLVYLQNTTGYMVGTAAEQAGMVKRGSTMIQAVANATVPQLTIQVGASYGAGNYGMCGRAFGPRFLFAWPNARTAVMGGEQAGDVMRLVTEAKLQRAGAPVDVARLDAMRQGIVDQIERESTALFATARLWDDGLIDPRDTRHVLGLCLEIVADAEAPKRATRPSTFGVARF